METSPNGIEDDLLVSTRSFSSFTVEETRGCLKEHMAGCSGGL